MERRREPDDGRGRDETSEVDDVHGDLQTREALHEGARAREHHGEGEALTIEVPREQLEIALTTSPVGGAGDVDDAHDGRACGHARPSAPAARHRTTTLYAKRR